MAQTAKPVELKPNTTEAFQSYIHHAEAEMEQTLEGSSSFLWSDTHPQVADQVREGQIEARFWSGAGSIKVPNGLIHDWIAAALIAGTTVKDVLGLIQNYDDYKNVYKPEVIASRLISHQDGDFQIYLRLLKKKILTVVLDTDHDVRYRPISRTRWICRSYTTRVAEVEHEGEPGESVLPPDTGHGFLWRLYSYWRFEERESNVFVECRAISLTRDVPMGLGWMFEPIIQGVPKESLIHTLEATRRAIPARIL
ncbi:MAG: hypothetical protein WAN17_18160 [Candidatus Sulfotelmatobacter sp.]